MSDGSSGAVHRRHRNDGLRKVCGCPRRTWARCEHSWYLNFRHRKGKHFRISLDKHAGKHLAKEAAKALADELRIAIRNGTYPPTSAAPAVVTTDVVAFAKLGALWLERERQDRVGDWKGDRSRLGRLAAAPLDEGTLGERAIGRVTADDLEVAFRSLEAAGLTGRTLNKYLQTCQHLQRWGVRKGYLQRPWFDADNRPHARAKTVRRSRRLEADVTDTQGKVVAPGEERRLLAAANPWLQRLIIAAIETGMRRGELLKLQWRHVDLTRGHLRLPADITKTAEGRTVVISARLRPVLELIRFNPMTNADHASMSYVFGNAEGKAIASPKKAWEVCVLKAHGIKPTWDKAKKLSAESRKQLAAIDLHWHDLRHEAGSRWIEAGWPIHHVQQMLGHADLKQTSTYLNATVKGIEDSMRRHDEARGLLQSVAHAPQTAPVLDCNEDAPSPAKVMVN